MEVINNQSISVIDNKNLIDDRDKKCAQSNGVLDSVSENNSECDDSQKESKVDDNVQCAIEETNLCNPALIEDQNNCSEKSCLKSLDIDITTEVAIVQLQESPTIKQEVNVETKAVGDANEQHTDIPSKKEQELPSAATVEITNVQDISENSSANIIKNIDQNIEFNEVLFQSSDVTDNVDNNSTTLKQETFNKEELLDILQGNDDEPCSENKEKEMKEKLIEANIALKQLTKLRLNRKEKSKMKLVTKMPKKVKNNNNDSTLRQKKKVDNLVTSLVKDWEDEDNTEVPLSQLSVSDSNHVKSEDESKNISFSNNDISINCETNESTVIKSQTESHPKRRMSRVIKKKVIFDPDNPDTFTKGKSPKSKEPSFVKDQSLKDESLKMIDSDSVLCEQSHGPVDKALWKKPNLKNNKHNKRLTEVDKLLMDEGAVNMIYQLTPEAPKGKKNMRTKAEIIKKLQSSTPQGTEMKFRERKKEIKDSEGEAKKILGNKQRMSLNSFGQSPSISEDFDNNSVNDSIIYRRHSSSSYSSSCMSPRRLSDADNFQSNSKFVCQNQSVSGSDGVKDVFMSNENQGKELIDKKDCLSIKEKLNSKLSLVMNKRKIEDAKVEKAPKLKKISKFCKKDIKSVAVFDYIALDIEGSLANIIIKNTGVEHSVIMLRELERALSIVNMKKNVSVTLLSSESGTICSGLYLKPLLDEIGDVKKAKKAHEIAESVRLLLSEVQKHTKLLCCGVFGECSGVSMAIVGLCDLVFASEDATFSLVADERSSMMPGVAVFTSNYLSLSKSLVNELVVLGRSLSASEAVQYGLVNRTLWPSKFSQHLNDIVYDLAAQPLQSILLKKQLLKLQKSCGCKKNLETSLETEKNMFIDYWTSEEGQKIIQSSST